VPIYLAQLGKEGYGLIGLATSIMTYTLVADLGLREALGRQLAAAVARKDEDGYNNLASSAIVFYVGLSAVIGLALALAAPGLAGIFAVSPGCRSEAVFLIRWYATLASFLTLVGSVFGAALTSENRFDRLNIITSVTYAARALLLIVVLKTTHTGLRGWAFVTLGTELARVAMLRLAARRVRPGLRLRTALFRPGAIRSLLGLGVCSFGAQSARLLSAQSDPFVLSLYFGPTILVFYSPAVQLLNALKPFVYAVASQLSPVATNFHVSNNREKVAEVLTVGTRYLLLQGAGATAVVIGFSGAIMSVWLGNKLGSETALAASVLVTLAVIDLITCGAGTQYPVLLGMGRLKVFVVTAIPSGIVYIASSVLLVGHTTLGIYGVLVPNLVLSLLTRLVISTHAAKLCGLRPSDYLVVSYIRPAVVFVLLLGFCLMLSRLFSPTSYPALGFCALAALVVWVGLCWFVGFSSSDRSRMSGVLCRGWSVLKGGRPGEGSPPATATAKCPAGKC